MKTMPVMATAFLLLVAHLAWADEAAVAVGQRPPDELGKTTEGEEFRLSDGHGRVQIVSFWASWCPPCLQELPVLNEIQKQAGQERIRVAAVNLKEPRRDFRNAMRAMHEYEIDFIHDRRGRVADRYGVEAIPHMVILGPDGTVAHQHVGYGESQLGGIIDEINALLVEAQTGLAMAPADASADEAAAPD